MACWPGGGVVLVAGAEVVRWMRALRQRRSSQRDVMVKGIMAVGDRVSCLHHGLSPLQLLNVNVRANVDLFTADAGAGPAGDIQLLDQDLPEEMSLSC